MKQQVSNIFALNNNPVYTSIQRSGLVYLFFKLHQKTFFYIIISQYHNQKSLNKKIRKGTYETEMVLYIHSFQLTFDVASILDSIPSQRFFLSCDLPDFKSQRIFFLHDVSHVGLTGLAL